MRPLTPESFGPAGVVLAIILFMQLPLAFPLPYNRSSLLNSGPSDDISPNIRLGLEIDNECKRSGFEPFIKQRFYELGKVLPGAMIRLKRLQDKLIMEPDLQDEWSGLDISTLLTFEAIFGKVYGGRHNPLNAAYLNKLRIVKDRISKLIRGFPKDRNNAFEVWCNDNWLTKRVPQRDHFQFGTLIHDGIGDLWFDSRTPELGGDNYIRVHESNMCPPRGNSMAFMMATHNVQYGSMDVLTLCPVGLAQFTSGIFAVPFDQLRTSTWPIASVTPQNIQSGNILITLIHEISHSVGLLGYDITEDIADNNGLSTGWDSVIYHARYNPNGALQNADNMAFLVMTLVLSKYDWSLGFNQPMFQNGLRLNRPFIKDNNELELGQWVA